VFKKEKSTGNVHDDDEQVIYAFVNVTVCEYHFDTFSLDRNFVLFLLCSLQLPDYG